MQEIGQSPQQVPLDKNALVGEIKCEITRGVYAALHDPRFGGNAKNPGNSVNWFRQWVVKADLAMTVDDKGTFGPGVTFTSPFGTAAQSVSLGIGAQASSEAQRKEEIGFIYGLNDLVTVLERQVAAPEKDPNAPKIDPWASCGANGLFIHGDLKIGEFINQNIFLARPRGIIPSSANPFNVFSDTVQFVIVYGGSITPSWKLVRVSVNPSSPFASTTRTRTQSLILTFGPPAAPSPPPPPVPGAPAAAIQPAAPLRLNDAAEAVHNANLIGQAVVDAIRSATIP